MAISTKPWYTSKTLWFNVVTTVVSIVGTLTHTFVFTAQVAAIFIGILAVGNAILRFLTTTALTV